MRRRTIALACFLAALLATGALCQAGLRSPGKYCGVVIFDRWDGCTLYSGVYVMYVSGKVKERLRKYAGHAIQIDAKEVDQPMNPGDGLIGKFRYLGDAPEYHNWVKLDGISLESSVSVRQDGKPVAAITIRNKGKRSVRLWSGELALTLLMKRDLSKRTLSASDGPSFALITRQSFDIGPDSEPRWQGKGIVQNTPYSWTIGKDHALPRQFSLAPGQTKRIDVHLDLPDGEYDFLCGYGGGVHQGKCLASNLSAFDVNDGRAAAVEIKNR